MLSSDLSRHVDKYYGKYAGFVAEKVESAEMYDEARGLGYHLFQGYYFCRPTTFSGGALSARRLAYARLLASLNKTNVSVNSIEDLIKHDASLTYRVLRCINSAVAGNDTLATSGLALDCPNVDSPGSRPGEEWARRQENYR